MNSATRAAVFAAFLFFAAFSWAAPVPGDLEMTVSYEFAPEPVGTDRILELDPDVPNPHRQRWVLNRKINLKGLEIRSLPKKRFGVSAKGIESVSRGYIRAKGPWYQSLDDFPCQKEPDSHFSTSQGTRVAANAAGEAWKKLLKDELVRLSLMLRKISAPTPQAALKLGLQAYQNWLRGVEKAWAARNLREARLAEWAFYRQEAKKEGHCDKFSTEPSKKAKSVSWVSLMEPVAPIESPTGWVKPLVRAPARRWDGIFSVRLEVQFGARTLNGQFLVDSGSPRSIISPVWLSGQGFLPALVQLPGTPPERAVVQGESGLAPVALVDRVLLSEFPIDLKEFLIFDTDIFLPPENTATCCDGILGVDFLQKYVVEFLPSKFNEIALWPREGFRPVSRRESEKVRTGLEMVEPFWLEAYVNSAGQVVSDECSLGEKLSTEIHWETGSDSNLMAIGEKPGAWGKLGSLQCQGQTLVEHPRIEKSPDSPVGGLGKLEAGMDFLARGPFILDLPHGRIWFSKPVLEAPIPHNDTGLTLDFFHREEGGRILKVIRIRPGSKAAALSKEGLRVGAEILQVDSKPVESMDLWEIDQRLAGAHGDQVTLQWQTRQGLKTGTLKTR